ncbi:MAG TPA: hypothetical protein VOB72_03755 [Candidatus Dormibacteraeota bacterium]|nr:hypothetical protein [Candidatus Dormibacteraeota bacterium]
MTDERTLYIGTDHALYRARPGGDGRWRAEGLALAGMGGVRGFVIDPDEPRRWWACTAGHGVLVTEDEGIVWRQRSDDLPGVEGWCLARHPKTGDLWYGAGPTAIYRSADGGESWSTCGGPVDDDPAERPEWEPARTPRPGHVRQITLGHDGLVLAAVEEGWLLRSDDGGRTWTVVRDGIDRDCHAVSLVPGDIDTVIVTTGTGVYRSEDHGRTFAHSDDGLRHRSVTQVVLHPDRPDVLFTAAAECDPELAVQRPEGANGGFYRSDDGGRTWWRLSGGVPETLRPGPTCVAGDEGDPDAFYVGTTDGTVWFTEDGGETFTIAVEGIQGWVRHLLLARRR